MKWQVIFLLFFLYPVVTALEYNVGKINDCITDLNINVSGKLLISENEYSLKDCSIIQSNEWKCSCSKPIILYVSSNTINNYTFTIKYLTQKIMKSSSGINHYYNSNITYNDSIFSNPIFPINISSVEYPFYNITNEYKTIVMNVNPQPINNNTDNNVVSVIEVKKSIWQRFWEVLLELLRIKLW